MKPIRIMLVSVLCVGCSVSVGGDTIAACYRIEAAVRAFETRCGTPYAGELQDCGTVLAADGNGADAETCERELAQRSCEDLSTVPEACRLAYVVRP